MNINQFKNKVYGSFYKAINSTQKDNYDYGRFRHLPEENRDKFETSKHLEYFLYFDKNIHEYYNTYTLLDDTDSRELFCDLIVFRLLGHIKTKISRLDYSTLLKLSKSVNIIYHFNESPINDEIENTKLNHYKNVPAGNNKRLTIHCGGLTTNIILKQYYYSNKSIRIQPEEGDVCIDAGACYGDTALFFAAIAGKNGHVYTCEPLPSYQKIIEKNIHENGYEKSITLVPYAISDTTANLKSKISNDNGGSPGFTIIGKEHSLPTVSIDDLVDMKKIKKVDFIKMDIEGAELKALNGAKKTLQKHRPKLAISLYHKNSDFIEIPQWINENLPGYTLHLDHYRIHAEETVLYACCAAKSVPSNGKLSFSLNKLSEDEVEIINIFKNCEPRKLIRQAKLISRRGDHYQVIDDLALICQDIIEHEKTDNKSAECQRAISSKGIE